MKKMKKTLIGLIAAYTILSNVDCHNDNIKHATWNNDQVEIYQCKDSVQTKPKFTNYAVKTGPETDQFVMITDNNIYLRQTETGMWNQFQGGYEKALSRMEHDHWTYNRIGVMINDTIHTVTEDNLLVGIDGIGGYEPIRK